MDTQPPNPPRALRFGNVELRPAERTLLIDGHAALLGARAFDVLLALAERHGRLVSKRELIDLVWPGVVVEENNLQVQVSALRKLLGPQVIATIPGRGYRFTLAATGDADLAAGAAAAPAAGRAPRGNLAEPAPLIGRAAAQRDAAALIAPRTLVTIVGAGGIGKTRLAQALAWQQRAAWRDGVWWVELAALTDPARVLPTVAATLGVAAPAGDGTPGAVELAQQLAGRAALVVLDNCEHLVEAVSVFAAALLAHAPAVALLATSQELLKVSDEHVYRLEPLALPGAAHGDDPLACGAVELFVQRVRALQPAFALAPAQAPAVVEICRRLDGLPLAIELAAARVPLLGLEGLSRHLGARFRVLTGGTRMALRKHQTLRAALEWSHGLLDDDERTVFRRLGVFAGGFTLELAQLLAADEQRDGWAVLELLAHLVDKSLVVASAGDAQAVPRYALLESTRAFALEQLAAAGEAETLLRRHAQVMRDVAQTLGRRRWTLTVPQVLAAQRELDNLRAALDWATGEAGDRALAIDLLGGGAILWYRAGLLDEGLERMLALLPVPADIGARCEADFCLGIARLGMDVGWRHEYWLAARRAESLYRQLGDEEALAASLLPLATLAAWGGEVDAAQLALAEAQRLIGPTAPPLKRAALAVARGAVANWRGDHDEGRAAFEMQLALYRDARTGGESIARGNIGRTLLFAGRLDEAIATLNEAIAVLRRDEPWVNVGLTLGALAIAHALRGDAQALALARETYAQHRPRGTTESALIAAALHHARQPGEAARAMLIDGWVHGSIERHQWRLFPPTRAWQQRALDLVAPTCAREAIDGWRARGARLGEAEAVALAFDDAPLPPG